MKVNDMGYAALAVSIVLECPPDRAFEKLDGKKVHQVTQAEIEDLIKLRKEHDYKQLAEMFGISTKAVSHYLNLRRAAHESRAN